MIEKKELLRTFFFKYFYYRYLITGLLCLTVLFSFKDACSQTSTKLPFKYKEKLDQANNCFKQEKYREAIVIYKEVLNKAGNDTFILRRIGDSYRLNNDLQNSEEWYKKALESDSLINPINKLYLAQALTANGKYNEALSWFRAYYNSSRDTKTLESIKSLENISSLYKDTAFYLVHPLNILNSQYSETSPSLYKNGILFLSNGEIYNKNTSQLGYYCLYFSSIDSTGKLSRPDKFDKGIKSEFNEGPIVFYDSCKKMIFSQSPSEKINSKIYQLYYSEKDSLGNWKEAQLLPFCNANYSFSQPFVNKNKDILYFSSNMPGGNGGMDIYMSRLENNVWSSPINMGARINSSRDDMTPFIFKDTLYFSSNGHGGLGGFDIFKCGLQENDSIINLGAPINSSHDDFGLVFAQNGKSGYFTSNRQGVGQEDIYAFQSLKEVDSAQIYIANSIKQQNNSQHVIYKIQIRAARNPIPTMELYKKYKGSVPIDSCFENGWYKYSIGKYASYSEAKQYMSSCNVYDAFIVAYIDNIKVHIATAKTATNETRVPSPIYRNK